MGVILQVALPSRVLAHCEKQPPSNLIRPEPCERHRREMVIGSSAVPLVRVCAAGVGSVRSWRTWRRAPSRLVLRSTC